MAAAAPAYDLQERLRRLPGDYEGWAALGSSYVDKARLTGDPSWYGKAEQAVARSLGVRPGNPAGLTGRASLEAGRHEFTQAVATARQAIAVNPYGAPAYGCWPTASTSWAAIPRRPRRSTR